MITPSFGLTATERVLPKLALDFTTASLDNRITFTRALNTATRVNSSGYIESVLADTPRFDYDPLTLVCKGLLIEEVRENRFIYSEDFNAWSKTQSAVTTDATAAPTNALTADKLTTNIATAEHSVLSANQSIVSGTTYTASVFVKAAEKTFAFIGWNSAGFGSPSPSFFNLTTGVATAGTGQTVSMTNYGNGWWRCTTTRTASATASSNTGIRIGLTDSNSSSSSTGANTTDGLYLWGAQFEVGAFATSYIPTISSFVTRNADVATMTGTNFSDWYNASEGTFLAIGDSIGYTVVANFVSVDDGTSSNRIQIRRDGNAGMYVVDSTFTQASFSDGVFTNNASAKIAGAYKLNSFNLAYNGTLAAGDNSGSPPASVDKCNIGAGVGTHFLNGHIGLLFYYPQRLLNSELQAVTT